MVQSKATTVAEYLASLPADRRKEIEAVRNVVLKNLPKGFAETMNYGMISYEVPLARYPSKNKRPLAYAALAAQKNFNTLYLMSAYARSRQLAELQAGFKKAGKTLDMGKSCIHFQGADDLPLDVIGKVVKSVSVDEWIETFEQARRK